MNGEARRITHRVHPARSRPLAVAACALLAGAVVVVAQTPTRAPTSHWRVPRMADGRPDLQGTWTNNTATPLVRPRDFAAKRYFTREDAAEFERTWLARLVKNLSQADRLGADLSEVWFDRRRSRHVVGSLDDGDSVRGDV